MLRPVPPMSNTERQRLFRERHPGYYGRLHARRRAATKASVAAAALAAARVATPATRAPHLLLLPAPVAIPVIPGLNAIGATPAPAPLLVSQSAERSIAA